MLTIDNIQKTVAKNIKAILAIKVLPTEINLDIPPNDKLGDFAFSCFNLAKKTKLKPQEIATKLATSFVTDKLITHAIANGPYLNIFLANNYFVESVINEIKADKNFGHGQSNKQKILIEFSGPNTNKPQHIGHLRNNCIGQAMVGLLQANGYTTMATNIINDRGIHIVKSMLAWQEFGQGETPQSSGLKGDHLVGKYYVKFGQILKEEENKYLAAKKIDITKLSTLEKRQVTDEFLKQSVWMQKAQAMLLAWEAGDKKVLRLWRMMNAWVYAGYRVTYQTLGIKFDQVDYESNNYLLGKKIIAKGLQRGLFYKKDDGSVWVDLKSDGLDEKLLLRADGSSVYITQDLGTAISRQTKYKFNKAIYVVAAEQDYHFKVLFATLKKLGYGWADKLYHLSYGLVSLPGGRIKSREGQTADIDDIILDMRQRAKDIISSAHKKTKSQSHDSNKIIDLVAIGAVKFFMLSTNPQKNIVFNPEKSLSFDGYTGTFVQYTHARIQTLLTKANYKKPSHLSFMGVDLDNIEKKLARELLAYPDIIRQAAINYNPSLLTQYLFNLAQTFNHFYEAKPIIKAEDLNLQKIRLTLSAQTQQILKDGLNILGIAAPLVM